MRVLIAEDESRLAESLARGLRREGMAVDVANDGEAALYKARVFDYDVVLLDRDLPLVHGDRVCQVLATERPDSRLLMVTASGELGQLVDGLSLGADDYLAKPFAFAELVARVRALGRRSRPTRPPLLRAGDVTVDPARRSAERSGRPLDLTPKELAVLELLLEAEGAAVSNEALLHQVWDENADPFSNTVRMTVMTLRRKLGPPAVIETVKGAGYRV